MPKVKISEYSATANSNTDVASINIDEGCAPSGINNAIRAVMGHLKDFQQGTNGDPFNGPVNGTVGATTPSTGAFTTLSASGVFNNSRAAGADTYINHITTGINNTVMGFNNSGATNGSGVTNNTSYIGSLNAYSTWVVGNGATIAKFVSSAQGDQGLIVNGVVGIGTSSPGSFAAAGRNLVVGTGTGNNGLTIYSGNASGGNIYFADGTTGAETYAGFIQYSHSTNAMLFGVNNTGSEAMTLDGSGNLGIGTTAPQNRLQVVTTTRPQFSVSYNGITGLYLEDATNSAWKSWKLSTSFGNGSDLSFVQSTNTSGTPTWAATAAMTLDASGNLLVGTTSTSPGYGNTNTGAQIGKSGSMFSRAATDYVISVNQNTADGGTYYQIVFRNTNGAIGSITSTSTVCSYNSLSDYRLKNTIAPITGALAKVALLKPCTYKWNADGSTGEGFIAHELAEVCPQAVTGEKDAVDADGNNKYQGIDTSFLVATLTAAIQELKAEFDAYKASHP